MINFRTITVAEFIEEMRDNRPLDDDYLTDMQNVAINVLEAVPDKSITMGELIEQMQTLEGDDGR